MLVKIATHVVAIGLGAAVGIYWGVNHPQQALAIHDAELQDAMRIKAAIAQGKQQAFQQVINDRSTTAPTATPQVDHYKQLLQSAQQEFNDAKAKLASGATGN